MNARVQLQQVDGDVRLESPASRARPRLEVAAPAHARNAAGGRAAPATRWITLPRVLFLATALLRPDRVWFDRYARFSPIAIARQAPVRRAPAPT